jgi:hypothetical protein
MGNKYALTGCESRQISGVGEWTENLFRPEHNFGRFRLVKMDSFFVPAGTSFASPALRWCHQRFVLVNWPGSPAGGEDN